MTIKRFLILMTGLLICTALAYTWIKYNEGGPVPYPINTGSFFTVGSAVIDPLELFEDVRNGRDPLFLNSQSELPEEMTFVMPIGWSQGDYFEIAKAIHKVIWDDDLDYWQLYRMSFFAGCENADNKFESADFYYYQEVTIANKKMYSVRNILIEPEYGYVIWGGNTFFPRPIWGWDEISLETIQSFPAEQALELADQQGGADFRNKENNICRITADMWPWGYDRNEWRVNYRGKDHLEFWVPLK